MKRNIFIVLFVTFIFLSCNKNDIWVGTWITPDWKYTIEKVEIRKKQNGNYTVTIINSSGTNKFNAEIKNDGKVLEVDKEFYKVDFTQNSVTNELIFGRDIYPKLDKNLLNNIGEYIEEMRNDILGKWKFTEERILEKKSLIDEYQIVVTKGGKNNIIDIKTEIIKNKGEENEEKNSYKGKFEILPTGEIVSKDKNKDISKFFPKNIFSYSVKQFEKFERIGTN